MLRGRKIIYKREVKKEPVRIEKVVPVIASSLAGANVIEPVVIKKKKGTKNGEKEVLEVVPVAGSKKPATIFLIAILFLGFYVIYDQFINEDKIPSSPIKNDNDIEIAKIDDTKDYIYYEHEKDIDFPLGVDTKATYKDITININSDSVNSLNYRLNKEYTSYYEAYKFDKNALYECVEPSAIDIENTEDYTITYRDYKTNVTNNYITVIVTDYSINYCGTVLKKIVSSYVIDKKEGIVYSKSGLLSLYDITEEDLIKKAISGRTDGNYGILKPDEIVKEIQDIGEVELYIDSKECLGIYYTGIMYETTDDTHNISLICK